MARSLPELLLTEHPVSASVSTVIALNYGPETRHTLTLRPGWQLGQVVCGHVTEPSPARSAWKRSRSAFAASPSRRTAEPHFPTSMDIHRASP